MSDPALGTVTWWLALLVLVVNDHALKGAGVLPGGVTGKVSDLAFLVVAAPLLATLVGPGSWRRVAAYGAVGLGLAAINLSPALSATLVDVVGALGGSWQLTPDPTDLVALAVLPALLWASPADPARTSRRAGTRAGIVVGSVACLASPSPDDGVDRFFQVQAVVVNDTGEAVDVRVRWASGLTSCDEHLPTHLIGAFAMDSFGEGRTFTVARGDFAPLDPPVDADPIGLGRCPPVALIAAPGLTPHVVAWRGGGSRIDLGTDPRDAGALHFLLQGSDVFRTVVPGTEPTRTGDALRGTWATPIDAVGVRCEDAPRVPIDWPDLVIRPTPGGVDRENRDGRITAIEDVGGGCHVLVLEDPAFATPALNPILALDLCLPENLPLPFEVGDRLDGESPSRWPTDGSDEGFRREFSLRSTELLPGGAGVRHKSLRLIQESGTARVRINPRVETGEGEPTAAIASRLDAPCAARTTLCGARVRPLDLALDVAGRPGAPTLGPGDAATGSGTIVDETGRLETRWTVVAGRVEDVIMGEPDLCDLGRSRPGMLVEIAVVTDATRMFDEGDEP